MNLNLASILEFTARLRPDAVAVIDGDRRVTYRELDLLSGRIATALDANQIGHNDVVALICPNTVEFVACFYGVLKTGAAVMPINFLLRAGDIAAQLNRSGAKALFCHGGSPETPFGETGWEAFNAATGCQHFWRLGHAWPGKDGGDAPSLDDLLDGVDSPTAPARTNDDDLAILSFTSGTTGTPKGVRVSHGNEYTAAMSTILNFAYTPDDVVLVAIPLFTSFSQIVLLNGVVAIGGTMVLVPRFEPGPALAAIEAHRVTVTAAVPTIYLRLTQQDDAAIPPGLSDHWRIAIFGGSGLNPDVHDAFVERFGVPFRQAYGLTECRIVATNPLPGQGHYAGLIPSPGFTLAIVDESMKPVAPGERGELLIRGPSVMDGYLEMPELNAASFHDGWYRTGDLAIQRDDGLYYIVGRLKDIISRGGYKIDPGEVETVMRTHPDIREAAVVGAPDPEYGEEVAAFVEGLTPSPHGRASNSRRTCIRAA